MHNIHLKRQLLEDIDLMPANSAAQTLSINLI